jgi:hypothetical protein
MYFDKQQYTGPGLLVYLFTSRPVLINNDPNLGIYMIRPDGTGLKQITTNILGDTDPLWRP